VTVCLNAAGFRVVDVQDYIIFSDSGVVRNSVYPTIPYFLLSIARGSHI